MTVTMITKGWGGRLRNLREEHNFKSEEGVRRGRETMIPYTKRGVWYLNFFGNLRVNLVFCLSFALFEMHITNKSACRRYILFWVFVTPEM